MAVPQSVLDIMHSPGVYLWDDASMGAAQRGQRDLLYDINSLRADDPERERLLRRYFGEMGEDVWIEPPLRANWGVSTHLGDCVYANANLTLVDDSEIFIGDHTMIGSNVTLVTTGHPIRPDLRERDGAARTRHSTDRACRASCGVGGAIVVPDMKGPLGADARPRVL